MNHYELALVLSANIEESVRNDVLDKAKSYIERYADVITGVEAWGKRRLAYEIRHQREAFYYFIHFNAEPDCPGKLEQEVRIMDNILRYLIVREEEEYVPKAEVPQEAEEPAAAVSSADETADEDVASVKIEELSEEAEVPAEEAAQDPAPAEDAEEVTEEPAEEAAPAEEASEESEAE